MLAFFILRIKAYLSQAVFSNILPGRRRFGAHPQKRTPMLGGVFKNRGGVRSFPPVI